MPKLTATDARAILLACDIAPGTNWPDMGVKESVLLTREMDARRYNGPTGADGAQKVRAFYRHVSTVAASDGALHHWTPEVEAKAAKLFPTLKLAELRRRQTLCELQTAKAFEARNTRALGDLQKMSDALMRAVLAKV